MVTGNDSRDVHGRLAEDPFSHRLTQSGEIHVSRGGRVVSVVGGASAAKLIAALECAEGQAEQLLLAKATGNYKRGNER